jgi:hypothetical protein
MLGQKVDISIMAGKRKQLSNDIKNVIVEMRKSGHKLQEIADTCTLNIPLIQGTLNCSFRQLSLSIFIKSGCHVLQWGLTVAPN